MLGAHRVEWRTGRQHAGRAHLAYGVRTDIPAKIETLLTHGRHDDFRGVLATGFVRALGRKLVAAGGLMAPLVVFVAVRGFMTQGYADHVAALWRRADVDEDDIPTLCVSGNPPAGRLGTPLQGGFPDNSPVSTAGM
jgi:hypothetical protein